MKKTRIRKKVGLYLLLGKITWSRLIGRGLTARVLLDIYIKEKLLLEANFNELDYRYKGIQLAEWEEDIGYYFKGGNLITGYWGVIQHLLYRVVRSEGREIHPLIALGFTHCENRGQALATAEVLGKYYESLPGGIREGFKRGLVDQLGNLTELQRVELEDLKSITRTINLP